MNALDLIKRRRSIRRFTKRKVDDGILIEAIEAALWAPSAGDVQDKSFVIVRNEETKLKIVEAVFDQVWVAKAPVILVLVSDLDKLRLKFRERAEFYATISAGAAVQNILLYLTAKGLQGTHVGLFDELMVKRILDIPDDKKVFSVIALGYPAEKPPVPKRALLKEVIFLESYGNKWVKNKPHHTYME